MNDWAEPPGEFDHPTELVQACIDANVQAVVVEGGQLPSGFFDLSTGIAGEWLQKLDNYRIRLAVVVHESALSSRFGDLLAEERTRGRFGVFTTIDAARAYLRPASSPR